MKRFQKLYLIRVIFLSIVVQTSFAQAPKGTDFIDKPNILSGFKDKSWYIENIPFLEVPDEDVQRIYHYRWFVYKMHLRYINQLHGYTVTEFADDPSWSAPYGGISAPAGHQVYEGRWLRNQRFMDDFEMYWANGPGHLESRNYSFWMADAYYARYLVNADKGYLQDLVDDLVDNYDGWEDHYDGEMGMYWQIGLDDGMEFSASSYRTADQFRGGPGYRPTINAYMYGDAMAISRIYKMLGDNAKKDEFADRANALKLKLHEEIWDNEASFFKHKYLNEVLGDLPFPGNKYFAKHSFVDARELIGYVPWYFNMVEDEEVYVDAWNILFEIYGFYANYGPTTLERSHELFRYEDQNCCRWNGMSWPYANSQTLTAMANVINNYKHKGVLNKDKYFDILKMVTRTHYKNDEPYIAEAHDPDRPIWTYDTPNHSEHYLHSSYTDLVITGLIGLRPRGDDTLELNPLVPDSWDFFLLENVPYHGHLFTFLYDKTGSQYNQGSGLRIYQNGMEIHTQVDLRKVMIDIAPPALDDNYGIPPNDNSSANPDRFGFPQPSASFTSEWDNVWEAVDGKLYFDPNPRSRWTSYSSPNKTDWFAIDYGSERSFEYVDMLLFDDGGGVKLPVSYKLQYWKDSEWVDIPNQVKEPENPIADRNTISFPEIVTNKLRVVFTPIDNYGVGIVELETWDRKSNLLVTAVNETIKTSKSLNVWPNPFHDIIYIQGQTTDTNITLYHLSGKILIKGTLGVFKNVFNLGYLKPGVYLLMLEHSGKITTKKIIKYD